MAALRQEGKRIMQKAWAPRTLQMFEVGKRSFEQFRASGDPPVKVGPASSEEIADFISYLSLNKKAPSTMHSYVCAIANWHKVMGWQDPCKSFQVKAYLKGVTRDTGAPDARKPITIALLSCLIDMLPHICSSPYEVELFKGVFLLAFFGLFRIGELVCANKTGPNSRVLQISDIAFKANQMRVIIRFSKTDQTGKSTTIIFEGKANEKLCPVQGMKRFLEKRRFSAGPLFRHADMTYLSRFQFNKVLQMAMEVIDKTITDVKSHSFRIGGATNAISKGVPYEKVKEMGRWQSDAAKKYIRLPCINVAALV